MSLSEADTHAKLVNPAIYARGWTEEHLKREETTGAVEIIAGKARRRSRARYEKAMGFSLEAPAAGPMLRPYKGGEGGRRYYQDAAIRAVFEKVARDQESKRPPRALLSLATGAGKTFIAANLLRRTADAG